MKLKIVLLIVLSICFSVNAQNYKFGKVSKAELEEVKNEKYPEAHATVLYRKHDVRFEYLQGTGFVQKKHIFERVKIYDAEGFNYATQQIKLYAGSNSTEYKLVGIKGVTYTQENGKIMKTKLKKDGIFKEEVNKFWKATKFTMPNIKNGCVIEYEYTINSNSYGIDDIPFQKKIPIKKLDFKLKSPEFFVYKSLVNPKSRYVPKINTKRENEKIILSYKGNPENNAIDAFFNFKTASLVDVPPLSDEQFVDNIWNYQSKLILELNSVAFPNEPIKNFSTSWEKVTKRIYQNSNFGIQLHKTKYFAKDVDALLKGVSDPVKKVELIFNFVKTKVKWNDYYGYLVDEGVSKAYKNGVGNVADINLMLIAMLRYAKLTANPILVSTKNNGTPLIPTRTGFNYVICGVELQGKLLFLDATRYYTTTNILPETTINWLGRLIKENNTSEWIELIPKKQSKDIVYINATFQPDLSVKGKIRRQLTDYQAARFRRKNHNIETDQMVDNLMKKSEYLEIEDYSTKNIKNLAKPIVQDYKFILNEGIEEIGDKLYFNPLFYFFSEKNPFKEETRQYPIDFVHPTQDKYMINIKIPEGYVVESFPKTLNLIFNDSGKFTYITNLSGQTLQISITLNLNLSFILANDYPEFKRFFKLMLEKEAEKVVLKKT